MKSDWLVNHRKNPTVAECSSQFPWGYSKEQKRPVDWGYPHPSSGPRLISWVLLELHHALVLLHKERSPVKQNMRKASAKNNNNDTCKPCWLSLETCCDDVNSLQNAIHGRGRKEMRIEHHLIMQIDVGWVVSLAGGLAGG